MKWLSTLERKHIPNFRRNKHYKIAKVIILTPIVFPVYLIQTGVQYVISKITIKRKDKPDIKLQNIINGWANLIFPDPEMEALAKQRAAICAKCPLAEMVGGVHRVVVDNKTVEVRGLVCTACGCPLSAKVRSKGEYCPHPVAPRW